MIKMKRLFFKILGKTPLDMNMVQYWKYGDAQEAILIAADQPEHSTGATMMRIKGETETFPGYPRGHLLYGELSKIKHEIKNQIFNESWRKLEENIPTQQIVEDVKTKALPNIYKILDEHKYNLLPQHKLVVSVKEIYRTLDKIGVRPEMRDLITYIMQEDDAYRFRFQWIAQFHWILRRVNGLKWMDKVLQFLEHAEIVGDMKERIRLLRRVLLVLLEDKGYYTTYRKFCKEANWKKIKMSKADKYYFRGKYFKVDLDKFEY